jgi:hypothetical protein
MQFMVIFEILLLVGIVAGAWTMSERRGDDERRSARHGGRRAADAGAADIGEPTRG